MHGTPAPAIPHKSGACASLPLHPQSFTLAASPSQFCPRSSARAVPPGAVLPMLHLANISASLPPSLPTQKVQPAMDHHVLA
eukprot:364331-Chlamydomonas_euryale.AAC.12